MTCPHTPSGCNYPEGECAGLCTITIKPTTTMKFTTTITNEDGTPAVVFHAKTQQDADANAAYTSACVLRFAGMPIDVIQNMPKAGVPGLALELGRYVAMEEAIHLAAVSDLHWETLRQEILMMRDETNNVH